MVSFRTFSLLSEYLPKDNKSFCLNQTAHCGRCGRPDEQSPCPVELGQLLQPWACLASPESPWCLRSSCCVPMAWLGCPPALLLSPHSECPWGSAGSQAGSVWEQTLRFCYQPLHQQSRGGGAMEGSSHLLCNSPSSPVCTADTLMHQWCFIRWCWGA